MLRYKVPVIAELESAGADSRRLEDLRVTAEQSRDAVYAGDFAALGRAMIANTEAQGRLHPDLVGPAARACGSDAQHSDCFVLMFLHD